MGERGDRWQRRLDFPVIVAALATVPLLILEHSHLGRSWHSVTTAADWATWVVFAADLAVMLCVSQSRWAYLRAHPLDLVVVVLTPPVLPAGLQALRVIRVLRVLRLVRLGPLARRTFSLEGVRYAAILAGVTLLGGAEAFSAAENVSYATGVYWALQTMTTVGYGDVVARTVLGKVISCAVMLIGIGFFALITGAIAQRFLATEIQEVSEEVEIDDDDLLGQITQLSQQIQQLERTVRRRSAGHS